MSKVVKLNIEHSVKLFVIFDPEHIKENYGINVELVDEYNIGIIDGKVVTNYDITINASHDRTHNAYSLLSPTFNQLMPLMANDEYISSTAADIVAEHRLLTVGRETYRTGFDENGRLRHIACPINYHRYGVSNAPYTAYGLQNFVSGDNTVRTMSFMTVPGNVYDDEKIAFTTECEFSSEEREMIDKWISFINKNVPPLHKVTLGIHEGKMFIVDLGLYFPAREDYELNKARSSELIVHAINQYANI